jgi:hypothetical protein
VLVPDFVVVESATMVTRDVRGSPELLDRLLDRRTGAKLTEILERNKGPENRLSYQRKLTPIDP